jgi:hypothetical protein
VVGPSWWLMAALGGEPGFAATASPLSWGRQTDPMEPCSLHNELPGYSLGRVDAGADHPRRPRRVPRPSLVDLARFVFFSGLTFLAAWIAAFGRVAYTIVMLVIAAALAYAVLDLVDMEIVKRKRHD